MRKVKITKQQTVNPKAVYMGLSIPQIILMVIGISIAIGVLVLFVFVLGLPVNLTMFIIFAELLFFVGFSIVKINGMNLFKWIYVVFQKPFFRAYQSKGVLDTYEKEEKEQQDRNDR